MWSVDRMTDWGIKPTCFAVADQWEQCFLELPVLVYSELCLTRKASRLFCELHLLTRLHRASREGLHQLC